MDQLKDLSSGLVSSSLGAASWTLGPILKGIELGQQQQQQLDQVNEATIGIQHFVPQMPISNGREWVAIAGIMGASAVAIGAYGAHVVYPKKGIADSRKALFEMANKYHFLNSLALFGVPFARRPNLTGGLFTVGTLLLSGAYYYSAIADNKSVLRISPIAGIALVFAWLSLAL